MTNTITINTNHGKIAAEVKWQGKALAVHRPYKTDGFYKEKCNWTITHIESQLMAGRFFGPIYEAIQLAKAWDDTFAEELSGPEPNAKEWPRADEWKAQVNRAKPVLSPRTLDAILKEYVDKTHEN